MHTIMDYAALRFDVLEALVALTRDLMIERWRSVGTCIVIIHVLIYVQPVQREA